jgi:hypothetical protein
MSIEYLKEVNKRFSLINTAGTFQNIFGQPLNSYRDVIGGMNFGLDIVNLDGYLLETHDDYDEEVESMNEFVTRKYGEAASELISYLLMEGYDD